MMARRGLFGKYWVGGGGVGVVGHTKRFLGSGIVSTISGPTKQWTEEDSEWNTVERGGRH